MNPAADEARPPAPGERVTVEGTRHGPLATVVERWEGDDLVGLDPPVAGGGVVMPEPGHAVRLDFRVDDVPCALPADVTEGPDARLLWCCRGGSVMRFQRRLDFRVRDALTARVHRIDPASLDEPAAAAVTRNLSAGGVLLETGARVAPGDVVALELDLPGQTVRAAARCVRAERGGPGDVGRTVAFSLDVSVAEEQRFREAVMLLQRRAIAKGLSA